jgi:hypothetical protein
MVTVLSLSLSLSLSASYSGFSMVFECFKRCKNGHEDLQDDPRREHPSTSRNADAIANVREVVTRERRWALRMMVDELNINKEMIRQTLP